MRLQTLILPSQGEDVKFAIVLDGLNAGRSPDEVQKMRDHFEAAAKRIGAVGVLIFSDKVEVQPPPKDRVS
jgi:hypothetical protein